MTKLITSISPIDNSIVAERPVVSEKELSKIINKSRHAQQSWSQIAITEKAVLCHKAIDALLSKTDDIAMEITQQMGRPIQYCAGELRGVEERARYMIDNAQQALFDITIENNENNNRFIKRVPLGIVFIIAPWNYPYLTAINSIIPALMAGNTVLLKHSAQTLLCAERFAHAFKKAGFPEGVFQYCHCDHEITTTILKHPDINFISFTGSVSSGAIIENSVAGLFKPLSLELGGNDPAYVRADLEPDSKNFNSVIDNIVDGAYFNSGQSCCAVERIYVHQNIYDKFVEQFIAQVKHYKLDNPTLKETSLGPVINLKAANKAREQLTQATQSGASLCIADDCFNTKNLPENYMPPQVVINVDHSMSIMTTESFAPIVGIMKVKNDQQAIDLMNDSHYGLTASIWSHSKNDIMNIANKLQTGTVFLNRCDYLDPALAWVGIKESGRGCSLSVLAYHQLTRPKSHHFQFL
ncbi:MAG: aldehyde dehydrogenase family protein [Gammaproteobacteria bacterium]